MSFLKALIKGREDKGRWAAAQTIQRLEYRNESVDRVYEMLKEGTIGR